jgi:8-oxo-dGTP pyrophosphatase MutT (NUDIX family)
MKACPVVLRSLGGREILAFEHPLAGFQLVKGTVEAGEMPREAAIRELYEEAGVKADGVVADLGLWESGHEAQMWSFHLCAVPAPLPDSWTHWAADDGGHEFRFFWHPLHEEPSARWHPVFRGALAFIRRCVLTDSSTDNPTPAKSTPQAGHFERSSP